MRKRKTKHLKQTLLSVMLLTGGSLGAAQIESVNFVQEAARPLPEETLRYNVRDLIGQQYDPAALNKDIKRLFDTGYFTDIVVETEERPDDKIALTFKVKVKPIVTKVVFEGNEKFKDEDLMREISLVPGSYYTDRAITDSANQLRRFYASKGYTNAVIATPTARRNTDGSIAEVVFTIDEKLRQKIDDVTFENANVYSQRKLRNSISNQFSYLSWLLDSGLLDQAQLESDKVRLRDLYWDKGYLDFKIEDIIVTPEADDPEWVDINFIVSEGEPYTVGTITVNGNTLYSQEELDKALKMAPGEIFDYQKEEATRKALLSEYFSGGYADASCRAERLPDFKTHTVDIDFIITEGNFYKVHATNPVGNTITKDHVILRELAVHPGDPLNPDAIEISRQRLLGMGYFNKVETYVSNSGIPDERNVTFAVEEKDLYEVRLGAGASSDLSTVDGTLAITNNNFDLFDPMNYFSGGGQRLRIAGMAGIDQFGGDVDFTEPFLFGIPLRFDVSGFWNQIQYDKWREDHLGVRTALSKKFFDDFTSLTGSYKFEAVDVTKMKLDSQQDQEGWGYISEFALLAQRDTRDSLTDPKNGYLLSAFGALQPKVFGSSNNVYKLEAIGSYYHGFFDDLIVWHVGGRFGVVSDFNRMDTVPIYQRYFLGGNDLRGFPYRRVSPLDENGYAIGGQTMLLGTTEISHPIWEFIRGAVFTDIGNAYSNPYSFGPGGINIGTGYGLRIMVPYLNMPIKLDLAYPVLYQGDSNQDGRKLRFHFNVGFSWGQGFHW